MKTYYQILGCYLCAMLFLAVVFVGVLAVGNGPDVACIETGGQWEQITQECIRDY